MSSSLIQHVDKLKIDRKEEWTPSRHVKGKLKYPDHYSLLLTLKGLPSKKAKPFPGRKVIWNTRKKIGKRKNRYS